MQPKRNSREWEAAVDKYWSPARPETAATKAVVVVWRECLVVK